MRVGLIGTGRIGSFHAATLRALPSPADLIVTDLVVDSAVALAEQIGAGCVATVDELFATHPDALIISSGTRTHADLLRRGFAAGIPMFCEKPVTGSLTETIDLTRAQRACGVPVQVGFQRRFDAGYRAARAAVASGELGSIHSIRAATHDYSPPPPEYVATSGGIFRDCNVHDFDSIRFVTGVEVASVFATGANKGEGYIQEAGDVDTAAAVLTLSDDTLALVSATRYHGAGHDVRLEVHGSIGAVAVGLDDSLALTSAQPSVSFPAGPVHYSFLDRFHDAYVAELVEFVSVVAGLSPSPCTLADGLEAFRVAEACDLSRRQGRPVRLSEIPGLT